MDTMINQKANTFKELEKNIFSYVCEYGKTLTTEILESYDRQLMRERDRKTYRHKGLRPTTIKTVYGEVPYRRAMYEVKGGGEKGKHIYLLDKMLKMENTGLLSGNLLDLLVSCITEMSYRECAGKVSGMTGQTISAMGVWNAIQGLGEKVCEEERGLVEAHKKGKAIGEREVPVLFEEADGVYITLQGKDRKEEGKRKGELKVSIAYAGWKKESRGRYLLDGKVITAGFSKAREFHENREAAISGEYNLDETQVRLLNADGATWIRKVRDRSTYFQLDPFHKYRAIKRNIPHKEAAEQIRELLDKKEIGEMFSYIETYRDSLSCEKEIEKAQKLYQFFKENEAGLVPYQERGIELPASPQGLEYRNMGTMENHIWSIIAKRMKNNHTSWSRRGGNHLAKILAKKCSGKLHEVTGCMEKSIFEEEVIEEIKEKILSSAKTPYKIGKGYGYPVIGHLAGLDGPIRGDRKKLLAMAGY